MSPVQTGFDSWGITYLYEHTTCPGRFHGSVFQFPLIIDFADGNRDATNINSSSREMKEEEESSYEYVIP
ncbi:MAG: hypothetical protein IPJ75_14505 [Ignavibacteriales bacterium]|nr:hypothetical protein [Ignavibacteriales bacterium]